MSPECFGLNVPKEDLGGYEYEVYPKVGKFQAIHDIQNPYSTEKMLQILFFL